MSRRTRQSAGWLVAVYCGAALCSPGARINSGRPADALEPVRAALRTLQFDRAIQLLTTGSNLTNPDGQYLLGLIYLNGIGTATDPDRALSLLQAAAEHGNGAAAYVLAGEYARGPRRRADLAHDWLERSARLGYVRAVEALASGRAPLERESVGASDPSLLSAWVMDCVRKGDTIELRRIGKASTTVMDDFGRSALAHAAEAGQLQSAATLLELGANVEETDKAGSTPLMIAAERSNRDMVELLLKHGADVKAADAFKRTAIFYAAQADQPEIVRSLYDAGAALGSQDQRGYSPLDDAIAVGADKAAAELRALGLKSNIGTGGSRARQTGKFDPAHPGDIYRGWPPVALAVARNDTASLLQYLDAGTSANTRTPQADTLLQVASDAHALESLTLLLARGADATLPDRTGHTVLWNAAIRGDLPVVKVLLGNKVSPDTHAAAEKTPLLAALLATHSDVAEALLSAGANTEVTDAQGHTALMLAAARSDLTLVRTLLEKHARTNAADHENRTALWYAASAGSRAEVDVLLTAGGIQAVTDVHGISVLHAAAAQPDATVLEPLLKLGVRIDAPTQSGDSPLLVAAAKGHIEVIRTLLAHSPNLDLRNSAGDTALIAASRGGYEAVCRLLVSAGANAGLRNTAGASASDVALDRGFASLAKELAGKG